MTDTTAIQEHMEVLGSDGGKVGVVDKVEGRTIKLTRNDPTAGGHHHTIPVDWVASVEGAVRLSRPAAEAMREWQAQD